MIMKEVWAIGEFPIASNNDPVIKDEYFRVKDIISYNNELNIAAGVYIPRTYFTDVSEETAIWVNQNKASIIEQQLPIVRYSQGTWTIDLGLVNRLNDTIYPSV